MPCEESGGLDVTQFVSATPAGTFVPALAALRAPPSLWGIA